LRDAANLQAALGFYRATLGAGYNDPALQSMQEKSSAIPPQSYLYLHGRTDGCMGVEVAEFARAELPAHARMEIVDGAGHFLHLERPDVVNRIILDFLKA
jgi:pimeloyl-ACP methyl ester carboxylesterase